jgi:hypothetical protein
LDQGADPGLRIGGQQAGAECWLDEAILALEIGELQDAGLEIDLTGFDLAEIAALGSNDAGGLTDPDETPEVPLDPVSVTGDVWLESCTALANTPHHH